MRSLLPLSLILTVLELLPTSYAAIPFEVITFGPGSTPPPHLAKRGGVPLLNNGNAAYMANISLGGVDVAVIIDTGSSDLWVKFPGTPPASKDTGKSISLNYAVGSASGSIRTTELKWDNFTIPDQAFLQVTDSSSFSADSAFNGLVGLGPSDGSSILDKLDSSAGDPVLNRIFQQNKATQNYITFLLDRKNDNTHTGQFTISEPVKGLENITSQMKLNVEQVHRLLDDQQHWQALTDKDAVIGPDGTVITIDSIVPKAPDGQLVAVFDSGFTFSQVPRDLSDAIYGRVQGAVYDEKNEWWTVPCGQELNLTFQFGGVAFPMHPLDVVDDNFKIVDKNGNHVCIGAFQPITSAFSLFGNFDMIMGMTFLRNAYTLMDFGDWADDSDDRGDPFMQLLPLTDRNKAHADFVKIRLNGQDTTGASQYTLLPAAQMQHSPVSAEEKKKKYEELVLSRWPYIVTGSLVGFFLLVGYIVWRCCCRKRNKKGGAGKKGFSLGKKKPQDEGFFEQKSETYLPLQVQSPQPGSNAATGAGRSSLGQGHGQEASPYGHHDQHSQASLQPQQQYNPDHSQASFQQPQQHQQYQSHHSDAGYGGYQQDYNQQAQYDYGQHSQYPQQSQYHQGYAQQQQQHYPQQGAYGYAS